jgi:hypothetical protein
VSSWAGVQSLALEGQLIKIDTITAIAEKQQQLHCQHE